MAKFKCVISKITFVLEYIIGVLLAVCLFIGGLGFIGYAIAFCIGGDTAAKISDWIYNVFYLILIRTSTCTVILVFVYIYLKGDAKWINPIKYWKGKFKKKEQIEENKPE